MLLHRHYLMFHTLPPVHSATAAVNTSHNLTPLPPLPNIADLVITSHVRITPPHNIGSDGTVCQIVCAGGGGGGHICICMQQV